MAAKKNEPVKKVGEKHQVYTVTPIKITHSSKLIEDLRKDNKTLLARVKSLEERLALVERSQPSEKVVVLREISKKDAEKEICTLFAKGETLYYSDIAEKLNLDLPTVVDICGDLQKRGEIKVDDNTL
jgi:DNA-binding MarR family transcriptional regulator